MREVAVVIPNYNGIQFLEPCLEALRAQTFREFQTILVDNGSSDGSLALVRERYPEVEIAALPENFGFCRAVNEGIRRAEAKYVILLNNDTQVFPDFVEALYRGIAERPRAFSAGAMMIRPTTTGSWIQPGIITALLDGLFPGEREKGRKNLKIQNLYLPSAPAPLSIGWSFSEKSDFLMKNILPIWRIWISATGPESPDMKTGICPRQGLSRGQRDQRFPL